MEWCARKSQMSDSGFLDYILEQLEPMGDVVRKRLFGGSALSKNGYTFALAFEGTIYFKVDDSNRADYEALGSKPFTYEKKGKTITISNWEVPADIIEDQERLLEWADKAYEVAVRAKKN